jgi:hypothetical protein
VKFGSSRDKTRPAEFEDCLMLLRERNAQLPDFDEKEAARALEAFGQRERRFGKVAPAGPAQGR